MLLSVAMMVVEMEVVTVTMVVAMTNVILGVITMLMVMVVVVTMLVVVVIATTIIKSVKYEKCLFFKTKNQIHKIFFLGFKNECKNVLKIILTSFLPNMLTLHDYYFVKKF